MSLAIADLRTLILALQAPEPEVAGKACDAIERFADACGWTRLPLIFKLLAHLQRPSYHTPSTS